MIALQTPTLILPSSYADQTGTLTSTETVADSSKHYSAVVDISFIQEKTIFIMATEVVASGTPGNLRAWVELSCYPSDNTNNWPYPLPTSDYFWAAIGGGGGAIDPEAPDIITGRGVNLKVHPLIIPFSIHAPYMRLVVDTPSPATTAYWVVQGILAGKTS